MQVFLCFRNHLHILINVQPVICVSEQRESKPANADRTSDDSSDATTHPSHAKIAGDGGESGDIVAGKSVVFATLEVCLYVLVRHMPALNPSIPSTGFQAASITSKLTEETCQLMSTALQIMSQLPALCSPAGTCHWLHCVVDRMCVCSV